jgi:4,5-DOPA dioxygenase extradiol
MYPEADIPVFQLSVDKKAAPEIHFKIGAEIRELREKGVLILGSGNVVHNLSQVNFDMEGGYEWAYEFDNYVKNKIVAQEYPSVVNYSQAGICAALSVPITDHFYPLLYVLGTLEQEDNAQVFNDACMAGSLSMTCYPC